MHSAADRFCWSMVLTCYEELLDTGVVREYWLNVGNTTAAPDGVGMPVQLINGSLPGATIIADRGDTAGMHSFSAKLVRVLLTPVVRCSLYMLGILFIIKARVFISTVSDRTGPIRWIRMPLPKV